MSPNEVTATSGREGRLSAAPQGGVYVRDPAAARAHALQERAKAFEDAGEEVPEELAAMLAEIEVDVDDEDVNLVDRITGELLAEVEDEAEEEAAGEEPEPQPEPEPEPEPEPQAEPEPEPDEPEPEPPDVYSLTVAELKAELDKRGIEYGSSEQKASLQVRLSDALGE